MDNLENILEGILFVSGKALIKSELCEKLGITIEALNEAIINLQKKYNADSGMHIITYNEKVQFATNPGYAALIAAVLNPIRERELSVSMLETLAIIAYKQPITRLEIEELRGVSCDYAVQVLIRHNLIAVAGRKEALGKPMMFKTTDEFLRRFQLKGLGELPNYETLLEKIKEINASEEEKRLLFENQNELALGEEELPDFLKDEENVEKIN